MTPEQYEELLEAERQIRQTLEDIERDLEQDEFATDDEN